MVKEEILSNLISKIRREGLERHEAPKALLKSLEKYKQSGSLDKNDIFYETIKEIALWNKEEKADFISHALKELMGREVGSLKINENIVHMMINLLKPLETVELRNIVNLNSGFGDIVVPLASNFMECNIVSIELNEEWNYIQRNILNFAYINNVKLKNEDILLNKNDDEQYDAAVYNSPFTSQRFRVEDLEMNYLIDYRINRLGAEGAYLVKAIEMVKDQGYIISLLPIGILFSSLYKGIREFILDKAQVLSIIELPNRVFENSGVSTVILVLRKKKENEINPKEVLVANLKELDIRSDEFKKAIEEFQNKWSGYVEEGGLCR